MPCCDLCVRRKSEDPQCQLSDAERNQLTLIGRVGARTRPNTDHQVIDVDAVTIAKKPGLRRKERLQLCQEALECWRQDLWNQDYLDSAISPKVLSDTIIMKLTFLQLRTSNDTCGLTQTRSREFEPGILIIFFSRFSSTSHGTYF